MKKFLLGTLVSTMLLSTSVFAETISGPTSTNPDVLSSTAPIVLPISAPLSYSKTLRTTDSSTLKVAPDTATISVSVFSESKTATESKANVDKAIATLTNTLKNANLVTSNKISVNNLYSYPNYVYNPETNESVLKGYRTEAQVTITLNDLDKLSDVLNVIMENNNSLVNYLSFESSKYEDYYNQALVNAVNTAKKRATYISESIFGNSKPQILEINTNGPGYSMYYGAEKVGAMNNMITSDNMASTSYIPKTIDIVANAEVVFLVE